MVTCYCRPPVSRLLRPSGPVVGRAGEGFLVRGGAVGVAFFILRPAPTAGEGLATHHAAAAVCGGRFGGWGAMMLCASHFLVMLL